MFAKQAVQVFSHPYTEPTQPENVLYPISLPESGNSCQLCMTKMYY